MSQVRRAVIAAAILAVLAAALASIPRVPETPEQRVDRIASALRCPVCQALSVHDSPSETARAIRDVIAQRVAAGRTDDEIRDEFRRAYGDWILLAPPPLAPTGAMWLLPVVAVAAGVVVAARRARPAVRETGPLDPLELAQLRPRVARAEELE